MIGAYFDDAGTHRDSRVVVLAGYIGPVSEWELLEAEWAGFLQRESLRFYHSVECVAARGPFAGRSNPDCNRLHRDAVGIITRRRLVPLGVAVDTPSYRSAPTQPHEELGRCFVHVVEYLGRYMEQHASHEQVALVLEEMPGVMGRLVEDYESLMAPDRLGRFRQYFAGPPAFRPKRETFALQAADVLAYETGVGADRHFYPSGLNPRRGAWNALSRHSDQNEGLLIYLKF